MSLLKPQRTSHHYQSTLLNKLTHTASEAAAYEFTTLTAIPGVIEYQGARIQLLDLPGIVEGASQGRGRGRQVVSSESYALKAYSFLNSLSCQNCRSHPHHAGRHQV